MDCKQFEDMLEELERETPMPAGIRPRALQHAESCGYCRARLASARLLSLELQALARQDEKLHAPAHVEASLLAAFRQKAQRPARAWRKLSWTAAAAVVVLAGWLLAAQPWRKPSFPPVAKTQAPPSPPPSASQPVKAPVETQIRVQKRLAEPLAGRRPSRSAGKVAAQLADEFIALPPGDNAYPLGEGMVVRVELPRSAPALVGLPLGGGDLSGTVTADVVLGQDGVARAIRFVQPEEEKSATLSSGFRQN